MTISKVYNTKKLSDLCISWLICPLLVIISVNGKWLTVVIFGDLSCSYKEFEEWAFYFCVNLQMHVVPEIRMIFRFLFFILSISSPGWHYQFIITIVLLVILYFKLKFCQSVHI